MTDDSSEKEILVVLKGTETNAALGQLSTLGAVTQVASPRVVILKAKAGELEAIRSLPGVAVASDDVVSQSILSDLNEQETWFVKAWNLRHKDVFLKKQRKGEGKPWDAEGFEPPDLPHKPKDR